MKKKSVTLIMLSKKLQDKYYCASFLTPQHIIIIRYQRFYSIAVST